MNIELKHKLCLEAMDQVKEACQAIGIDYFLLAGSALGAVRHSGFIPWDDDIDVGILFPDVAKFEQAINQYLKAPFEYINYTNHPDYPRLHGKILYHGENCIDIFPIVKISNNKAMRKIQWLIRKATWKLYSRKVGYVHPNENKVLLIISRILAFFIPKKVLTSVSDWNCRLFEGKATESYINLFSTYSMEKELISADCVRYLQECTFEDRLYTTLGNLDSYLTHLYGDYMKLPPVEKRVPLHEELFVYK